LGTPVVVAAQAAEALSARPGRNLLTAETAQEFAQATLQLLDDTELRATLSAGGRAYVEQYHDWGKVTDRLVDVYEQARETHSRTTFQASHKGGN
ncbi:MAG TPA: glycosyltransferase, partial [Ktedonobacteraceae bacterium]|nr:glycosyltransferase [Ktedonobacteraceae bacterium]